MLNFKTRIEAYNRGTVNDALKERLDIKTSVQKEVGTYVLSYIDHASYGVWARAVEWTMQLE